MRRLIPIATLILGLTGGTSSAAGDPKAASLVAAARAALGGETALSRVHGLSANGSFDRQIGDRRMAGDLTIDLDWPDRMLRTESASPMGDATIVSLQGIDGDRLIRSNRTIGGGAGLVFRVAPGMDGPDGEARAIRNERAEMTRLSLALLLTSPLAAVDLSYGGEAEAADGKADVIDVQGPSALTFRIFLDQATHLPLMLQYHGVVPRMVMQTRVQRRPPSAGDPSHDGPPDLPLPAPQPVEISLYFDDYRRTDGILFPHHITRQVDGTPDEEWSLQAFKINPVFKPGTFDGQ